MSYENDASIVKEDQPVGIRVIEKLGGAVERINTQIDKLGIKLEPRVKRIGNRDPGKEKNKKEPEAKLFETLREMTHKLDGASAKIEELLNSLQI